MLLLEFLNSMEKRQHNYIIVLGCGESILKLSEEEKKFINSCKYVIGINKFMAFYKKSGLQPNFIYFHDELENAVLMFKYILKVCRENNLTNLTFFTNKHFKLLTTPFWFAPLFYLKSKSFFKWYVFRKRLWLADRVYLKIKFERLLPPKNSVVKSLKLERFDEGKNWAKSLDEPLFNYKGSLSSILNLCSIISPNTNIYLVGNDFNGSKYFFQDELEKLPFDSIDYTSNIVRKENRHMSFITTNGKKFTDKLPYILSKLHERGNELFCINPESLLVKEGNVKYKKIPL